MTKAKKLSRMTIARGPLTRVILLLALLVATGLLSYSSLESVRERYQGTVVEMVETGKEVASHKSAAAVILKQEETFQSWAVLVLAGIVAILVTTKIHRAPGVSWAYLPLGPAAMFLLVSLNAGWVVTKRYAYLVAKNNFSDFANLSALLECQSDFFLYAITCISLFAGWFLFQIVIGKAEPFEKG